MALGPPFFRFFPSPPRYQLVLLCRAVSGLALDQSPRREESRTMREKQRPIVSTRGSGEPIEARPASGGLGLAMTPTGKRVRWGLIHGGGVPRRLVCSQRGQSLPRRCSAAASASHVSPGPPGLLHAIFPKPQLSPPITLGTSGCAPNTNTPLRPINSPSCWSVRAPSHELQRLWRRRYLDSRSLQAF